MIRFENASFLIVGLVHNCEKILKKSIIQIEKAFFSANKINFLIIESDSSDKSAETLIQISKNNDNFKYILLGNMRYQYSKRTARMAYCRNQYLKLIDESPEYSNIDYVVVADMDGVNSKINEKSVKKCWDRVDWDVCTANQSGPYYDIWALRHHLWSPNDCWEQARFLNIMGLSQFKSVLYSVYSRMVRISPCSEWIEVESAFGGLAIYRKEALLSVRYVGLRADGEEVCEHVSLHEQIRSKGGRIFINPGMINAGTVEHARNITLHGLARFWLGCRMRELVCRIKFLPYLKKALDSIKYKSS
ncbi:MAG: hypothetical protein EOM23_00710 [Candidatus Moranbacteria bacterium]|nr:hypothetical protein [Candidatus Moranbacteria bacterium]